MRVLLLHPEDSPQPGPWAEQRWDLVVDLGRSSLFSEAAWAEQLHCHLLRADSFRRGVDDVRAVRELFAAGRGRLLDEEGIDWWDPTSLVIVPQAEAVLVLQRLAAQINPSADLWATRPGWPASALAWLLERPLQSFSDSFVSHLGERARHYGRFFRRFSAGQIKQIALDKYDSGYEWRSRFASNKNALSEPVILLPSAYGNVSRMAASYARLLPEQPFLLVATRQSAKEFEPPQNVQVRDLASYAKTELPLDEIASILERWKVLADELRGVREFEVLSQAGVFASFPRWFRDCLRARNAWRTVFEREPIRGVLCGDDSNIYTRLPVLLAARRKVPTADFHHGALDGRYLLKELPCDVYLAKNEMERDYLVRVCGLPSGKVAVGAPLPAQVQSVEDGEKRDPSSVVFFSEPYEVGGFRAAEVYREILPPLCRVAREHGRGLIVKLHPSETQSDRKRIVRAILSPEDRALVTIVDGPLSSQLLSHAWFGVTVESTTVMDCLLQGIPCFLCGWLTLSSYEYARQYARFGIGEILREASEIAEIPRRLAQFPGNRAEHQGLKKTAEPEVLRQWLTSGSAALGSRRVS